MDQQETRPTTQLKTHLVDAAAAAAAAVRSDSSTHGTFLKE